MDASSRINSRKPALARPFALGLFVLTLALLPSLGLAQIHRVVVDTTSDVADGDTLGISQLIADPGLDGAISLREAIAAVNRTPNGAEPDTIHFAIGSGLQTIAPLSGYELFIDPVLIDATSQPGYSGDPIIELDGTNATGATAGLVLRTNDSTIRGFIIHSFPDEGLEIDASQGPADNNILQNNWIGIDPSFAVRPNADNGILLTHTGVGNLVGGSGPNEGNVICSSTADGILVRLGMAGTRIEGNLIGVTPDTLIARGNSGHGIQIATTATTTVVEANIIVNSGGDGIWVSEDAGIGNQLTRNRIENNAELGIDLGLDGVTANDPGNPPDQDTGANGLQNFPVLSSVVVTDPSTVTIAGTLASRPSTVFRLEFFAAGGGDPSLHGEAQRYLGSANVTTDGTGNVAFNEPLAASVSAGALVTATATDEAASTSEFSLNVAAVDAEADIALTKTVDVPSPNEGDTIVYTLTAQNDGPDGATGIVITDTLPAGVVYVSDVASQGSFDSGTGLWTVGNLANLASATLEITCSVDLGTATTTITNTANVTALDQIDANGANDSASVDITVPGIDLQLSKAVDLPAPEENGTIVFTLTLANGGPDTATNVALTDLLPAGVTYLSDAASQGSYDSGTGLWTVGSLAAATQATLDITCTVDAGTGGTTITNTANVTSADQADVAPGNETAAADVMVALTQPDLALLKSVDDASPALGNTLLYTLELTNGGPGTATGITVEDLLPAELNFVASTPSQGAYDDLSGQWNVGTLGNGATATLELVVLVAGGPGTTVTNSATVTGLDQVDPNPTNDNDSVEIDVFFYVDVTAISGADLGDPGPSTGVAWGDHDGDGDLDLYLGSFDTANRLFQNEGNDLFVDVATGVAANAGKTNGAAWADYDDDGDLDLYYANRGSNTNRLLRNDGGGSLVDVTPPATSSPLNGQSVAWADYDLDGDIDLYLANLNAANQLFRNDGSGAFADVTPAPLDDASPSTSVAWSDYDDDGDPDLFVANGGPNRLFRNDGGDNFADVASGPLAGTNSSFGADWGDYDNDGDFDLFFVNAGEANRLLRNDGSGFVDVTPAALQDASGQAQSAAWADIDNDGDLDVYFANLAGATHRLVRNDGAGTFVDITHPLVANLAAEGQGLAFADYDGDGDLDLYVAHAGQANRLYRNEFPAGNHWLHVDLEGDSSNNAAIGTRVTVVSGALRQIREISGGSGYLSQASLTAEFGLGANTSVDSVIVRWPSGILDVVLNPAIDQTIQLLESPLPNQAPIVTAPADQEHAEGESIAGVFITATDANGDTLTYGAADLPPGLSVDANTGEITGAIDCAAAGGSPYIVTISADDGEALPSFASFLWTVTTTPTALAGLTASQQLTANAGAPSGTTFMGLTWSDPGAGNSVAVYRKGYGGYPEYDDAGGSVPTLPATPGDALAEGWTLTPVTTSGTTDTSSDRDVYYYVAFRTDACGNLSGPSTMTTGILNYHLGDVSDGFTQGVGDRRVNALDLSYLSSFYGRTSADGDFQPVLDVGPTSTGGVGGRPLTDDVLEFEDLIIQSINFNAVSKDRPAPLAAASAPRLTALVSRRGDSVDVALRMQGDGTVRGLSIALAWDPAVVAAVGHTPGDLLQQHGVPFALLSSQPGSVDAALFAGGDAGVAGDGLAATMHFRVMDEGEPAITLDRVIARNLDNEDVALELELLNIPGPSVSARSALGLSYPNPFNPQTTVAFDLVTAGRVTLGIYSTNGRLVRVLVDEDRGAGHYEVQWDGRDQQGRRVSSGAYVARLRAPDGQDSRLVSLIK